jgi:hypothetical protein
LGGLDFADKPASFLEGAADADAVQNMVDQIANLRLHQFAMLAAHLLGYALEEQHPGAIPHFQSAPAFAGEDAVLATGRAEGGRLFSQHCQGHLQEPRQVRAGDRLEVLAAAWGELPLFLRPGSAELRLQQLNLKAGCAFAVSQPQREAVRFTHPELECAARQFEGGDRFGFGFDSENPAGSSADIVRRQRFEVGQ